MIKATGRTGDGEALLLLGLSRANTGRLHAGDPIKVHGQDVGMPELIVVIVGGDTEDLIKASLVEHGLLDTRTFQVPGSGQ